MPKQKKKPKRSKAAKERRKKKYAAIQAWKKKNRERTIVTYAPVKGESRNARFKHTFFVEPPLSIHFRQPDNGNTLLRVVRNALSQGLVDSLNARTAVLAANQRPARSKCTRSKTGEKASYHFGLSRRYLNKASYSEETRKEAAKIWLRRNRDVFLVLGKVFRDLYPELAALFDECCQKGWPARPWPNLTCNLKADFVQHYDNNDSSYGLCLVAPFGDFSKGPLQLREINVEVNLRPGDIAIFPSTQIKHGNGDVIGDRKSLVFYCSRLLTFPSASSEK